MKIVLLSTMILLILETTVITTRTGQEDKTGFIDIRSEKVAENLISLDPLRYELDRWLTETSIAGEIPSSVAAVSHDGQIIYSGAYCSSIHRHYSVASFTKTFVALAVLILNERGALNIDAPVSNYLPIHLENDLLGGPEITIRHLLTHTSGLASGGSAQVLDLDPPLVVPEQTCPAGVRFSYSNPGFNILGRVVARVSGIPAGVFIRINILEPLHMDETISPDTMPGASGIVSTANDLLKYGNMLAGRGRVGDTVIIKETSFNEMTRQILEMPPVINDEYRGIGWRVWSVKGVPVSLNHASLWDGSGGWMQVFPDSKVVYVFMSDPPSYDGEPFYHFYRGMKYRLLRMASIYSTAGFNPERFNPDPPLLEDLREYSGIYINPLNNETWEVRCQEEGIIAVRQGEVRPLVPSSRTNFVYLFPGQTEKGIGYDFIWRNGRTVALALSSGYYVKQEIK